MSQCLIKSLYIGHYVFVFVVKIQNTNYVEMHSAPCKSMSMVSYM